MIRMCFRVFSLSKERLHQKYYLDRLRHYCTQAVFIFFKECIKGRQTSRETHTRQQIKVSATFDYIRLFRSFYPSIPGSMIYGEERACKSWQCPSRRRARFHTLFLHTTFKAADCGRILEYREETYIGTG